MARTKKSERNSRGKTATGSVSFYRSCEGEIRKDIIKADLDAWNWHR